VIFFSLILVGGFLLRLWISGFSGVHPDEAYYWAWSLSPKLGYIENPPLLAWMIHLNRSLVNFLVPTSLLESFPVFFAQLKLRALPYFVSSVLTPLTMGLIIESVQRSPLLLSQMFCLITLPIALFGPVVVTPDVPFLFAWTLCLGFGIQFQKSRKIRSVAGDPTPMNIHLSLLSGATMAIAVYSGQLAFLIPILLIVSGIGLRNWLLSVVTAAVLSFPYLLWIHQYSGPLSDMFFLFPKAPLETLLVNSTRSEFWASFWSGQFFLWNPMVFMACFLYLILDQRRFFLYDQNSRFTGTLFLWAFVPLLMITAFCFDGPIEANWGLIGAVPASILVLARFKFKGLMRTLLLMINLAMAVGSILVFVQGRDIAPKIESFAPRFAERLSKHSRLDEFRNWRNLHLLLHTTIGSDPAPIVIPDRQTLASLIFAEESSPKNVRFGDRFRTVASQGPKANFFQRQPAYQFNTEGKERFWFFSKDRPKDLKNCRASQSLERIPGEIYWLLECNSND
jgi:hypothetical protein